MMLLQHLGGFLRAGFLRTLGEEVPRDTTDLARSVPEPDEKAVPYERGLGRIGNGTTDLGD
jgi:hypothetical protein